MEGWPTPEWATYVGQPMTTREATAYHFGIIEGMAMSAVSDADYANTAERRSGLLRQARAFWWQAANIRYNHGFMAAAMIPELWED